MALKMPRVQGVDHMFVRGGDLDFHIAVAGEGAPVLLLHGWPEHWYAWRDVMPRLAEGRRVLAMDLRGFGWTDIAWEGFEKENMADDVARVLEAMEIRRVAVISHDWGGWIGLLLAMRHPALVEKLIVLGSPPPWAQPYPASGVGARRLRQHALIASPLGRHLLHRGVGLRHASMGSPLGQPLVHRGIGLPARQIRRFAAEPESVDEAALALYTRDLKASTRARAGSLLHRTFLTREVPPLLAGRYRDARLPTPTLVLHGEKDRLFSPAAYRDHERHADDLRLDVVAGAGHYLPEEAPQVVAERALEFIGAGGAAPRNGG
jgi:pimeloyl-ACP methyl ester carboxylesterase